MVIDKHIDIRLNTSNLDIYIIRKSIQSSLFDVFDLLSGNLLDIGCGKMPYKEYILNNSSVETYIGLDIEGALEYDKMVKPDFTWDGTNMPFENDSYDCAIGTELLEHCPEPEIVLKEVYRVLKPGGVFFFTIPFLWNLHEVPHDEYRYTPFSLERHLKQAGFTNIEINATGGWHASLAQMMGLWVRRAPINNKIRNGLSLCFKPVIKYLINKDKKHTITFNEGQMITGLYGIAKK